MRKKDKFIRGVGVNDVDYPVYSTVNGKKVGLPEYVVWKNMLGRCYDQKYQNKYPTYIGCEVAPERHSLSNFTNWFHTNDWQDKQLACNAWREYKHKLALIYAEQQTDPRIDKALRERFKPY